MPIAALSNRGWTDTLRTLHPGERIYTFRKYFRNAFARDARLRIDHLLLSPAVAGRLVARHASGGRNGGPSTSPPWFGNSFYPN